MRKDPDAGEDLIDFQLVWLEQNIQGKKIVGNEVKEVTQPCDGFKPPGIIPNAIETIGEASFG